MAYICSAKDIKWVDVMIHNTLLVHHNTFLSEINLEWGKYYFYTLFQKLDAV